MCEQSARNQRSHPETTEDSKSVAAFCGIAELALHKPAVTPCRSLPTSDTRVQTAPVGTTRQQRGS